MPTVHIPRPLREVEFYDEALILGFGGYVEGCMLTPMRCHLTTVIPAKEVVEKGNNSSYNVVFAMIVEGAIPTPTRCRHTTVMLAHASIQSMH
jgi:hypothetical protein